MMSTEVKLVGVAVIIVGIAVIAARSDNIPGKCVICSFNAGHLSVY